jgi:hypothetical protein
MYQEVYHRHYQYESEASDFDLSIMLTSVAESYGVLNMLKSEAENVALSSVGLSSH